MSLRNLFLQPIDPHIKTFFLFAATTFLFFASRQCPPSLPFFRLKKNPFLLYMITLKIFKETDHVPKIPRLVDDTGSFSLPPCGLFSLYCASVLILILLFLQFILCDSFVRNSIADSGSIQTLSQDIKHPSLKQSSKHASVTAKTGHCPQGAGIVRGYSVGYTM